MRSVRATSAILFAVLVVAGTACLGPRQQPQADPLGAALTNVLAVDPATPTSVAVWTDVRAFYQQRDSRTAWVERKGPQSKSAQALDVLDTAANHGLVPADYDAPRLRQVRDELAQAKDNAPDQIRRLAEFDAQLTAALLSLGHDVAIGRTSPAAVSASWKARRTTPDLVGTLASASDGKLEHWLDAVRPVHPQYAALEAVLSDPVRLAASGGRGRPGGPGINEVADVIALNLERWRWMPDDFGATHLMVNIPAFSLTVREQGKAALTMRVVVGKPKTNQTPIVSGEVSTVVFSPSWGIPESIARTETARHIAKDPNYLEREGIDVVRVSNREVYRQRPGPKNALGRVKFFFENEHDVYLHDTPSRSYFAKEMRALSHGCVRLDQPEQLARYMLRNSTEWNDERIRRAMLGGNEQHVKLAARVPVHIVYFTVTIDDNGALTLSPDIYGYDARQKRNEPRSKD